MIGVFSVVTVETLEQIFNCVRCFHTRKSHYDFCRIGIVIDLSNRSGIRVPICARDRLDAEAIRSSVRVVEVELSILALPHRFAIRLSLSGTVFVLEPYCYELLACRLDVNVNKVADENIIALRALCKGIDLIVVINLIDQRCRGNAIVLKIGDRNLLRGNKVDSLKRKRMRRGVVHTISNI